MSMTKRECSRYASRRGLIVLKNETVNGRAGMLLICISVILSAASVLLCVLAVPGIVRGIPALKDDLWMAAMIFLWLTAVPVISVFAMLARIGAGISGGHFVSGEYVRKFRTIGWLVLSDVLLYIVPVIFFSLADSFSVDMVFACLTIQLCGAGVAAVSFAAAAVMRKAAEYKDEIDTMF